MEATAILQSDYLDILFDGRNKDYGGYELRSKYTKRVSVALLFTIAITLSTFLLPGMMKALKTAPAVQKDNTVVVIRQINDMQKVMPPPKQPAAAPKPLASNKLTTIAITEDEKVKDILPPIEDIQRVSDVTKVGSVDERITKDIPAEEKGIIQPAASVDDGTTIFDRVEIEASTNLAQWRRYLENNLVKYIEQAMADGMAPGTYTVNVKFVVERDGIISDVHALNDPGFGLARGAEDVLKKGPRWVPGEQNGSKVRSYHTQPVIFIISEQ
jgi:periplasmic protein TonB